METLEKVCSMLFFLSLTLNDSFGDVVGLHILSKTAILFFMFAALFVMLSKDVSISPLFVCLLVLNMAWWALSCLWTVGPTTQISTLFQNLLLCFFAYVYFSYYKNFDLLFYAMYFSGFILMFYSLSAYGYDGFIQALEEGERVGREITNENTFGKVFAYSVVSGVYLLIYKSKKLLGLLSVIFIFFAFSSGSKKSLLIMLIGCVVLLILRFGMKKPFKMLFIGAIIFLALYFILQLPIFEVMLDRFSSWASGEGDASDRVRADMIQEGWAMFKQKPIFGWGIEAFQELSKYNSYSHNNFIEMLSNFGLVGFCMFYAFYISMFSKLRTVLKYREPQKVMMVAILLSIVILDYGIVSYALKWNWIMIGAGMAMAFNTKAATE